MKVILLEFIDEAKLLLRNHDKGFFGARDTVVVCFHPNIRAFLKRRGIEANDTVGYLDNAAQHRIMLYTEELVTKIMERLHLVDSLGIREGYYEFCRHHLRMYANYFLYVIEILVQIKQKHEVTDVYACVPAMPEKMYQRKAFIQDGERFLGLLTKDFCELNKINFYPSLFDNTNNNIFNPLFEFTVRMIGGWLAFVEYKSMLRNKSRSAKTIVVPTVSYNMGSLLKEIHKQDADVRFVMIYERKPSLRQGMISIHSILKNWWKKIKKENIIDALVPLDLIVAHFAEESKQKEITEKEFKEIIQTIQAELRMFFNYHGVPFYNYLAGKIDNGLKQEMLLLEHKTAVLHNIFKRLNPKLLISMYSMGIYYTMGDIAKLLNIASLSISHGTHVPPNNKYEKIENYALGKSVILNSFQNVVVQTPWSFKFLDYYNDKRPRVICGPLLYSRIKTDLREKKKQELLDIDNHAKIIVHATTQKTRMGRRFHINETLDEYIASLADIVHAINHLEGVYFVLRPHPVCEITNEEFRLLLPPSDRLRIISNGPFADILSITDLLISYSSTCIEEALQEKIPVILFDKWKRYNHFNVPETKEAQIIQKSPVYYITDPQILPEAISRIFNMLDGNSFTEKELAEYRYPQDYRARFFDFVNAKLNNWCFTNMGVDNECCLDPCKRG